MEMVDISQSTRLWLWASYSWVKTSAVRHHMAETKGEHREQIMLTRHSPVLKDNHLQQETELQGVEFPANRGEKHF